MTGDAQHKRRIDTERIMIGKVIVVYLWIFVGFLVLAGRVSAAAEQGNNYGSEIIACTESIAVSYTEGFSPDDFQMVNTGVDSQSGNLALKTGAPAITAGNIVIPFRQEVYAAYLSGGDGDKKYDFGWLPVGGGFTGVRHRVYAGLSDTDHNGIIDDQEDLNQDGVVDLRDSRRSLGMIESGTEIVFYIDGSDSGGDGPFFTRREWNTDRHAHCPDQEGISRIIDKHQTGEPGDSGCLPYIRNCGPGTRSQGWLDDAVRQRLSNNFGYHFRGDRSDDHPDSIADCFDEQNGSAPTHALMDEPDETPFARVVGFDDSPMDKPAVENDYDFDDVVFLIEHRTGGTARLRSDRAIVPKEADATFSAVNLEVYDFHPAGHCLGKTSLSYHVSADDGAGGSWIEVTAWDQVRSDTPAADDISPSNWIPGAPEYTRRSRRIDLAGLGRSGKKLVWKAELISEAHGCVPEIVAVALFAETAGSSLFSHASPVIQANIIYSGTFTTPAPGWREKVSRGELTAGRIYDPEAPGQTLAGDQTLWRAGEQLARVKPDDRKIYYPEFSVAQSVAEPLADRHGNRIVGNGTTRSFSGVLEHYPVLVSSLRIHDDREHFTDRFADTLRGNFNGTGTINRVTGEWAVTFEQPPRRNLPIKGDYSYYGLSGRLKEFTTGNITNSMLGLTDEFVRPSGYTHDLNADGRFDEVDGDWLVEWVRGFNRPASHRVKEWLLGPIDHSSPALMVPPGYPLWYFGSQVLNSERESYDTFRRTHEDRDSVIFVGSRDGMLHAFDAGKFRHGDNPETTEIRENRGYFLWEPRTDDSPAYCADHLEKCPNYGTGAELWAFIPANLVPRLKNSRLKADEQAFVNASPSLADVFIDTNGDGVEDAWRTVLLSSEGDGGDSVFCLDVTDPRRPQFLWEFAAPEFFRNRPSPTAVQIGRTLIPSTGKPGWAAFSAGDRPVASGNFPAITMIDVSNGRLLNRIVLDDAVDMDGDGMVDRGEIEYGKGGMLAGHPALVDSDGNGFIDRLYVASDKGFIYKINLPDNPDNQSNKITHCILNADFSDEDGKVMPTGRRWQPVYAPPAIVIENGLSQTGDVGYRVGIFFGTGDSPYFSERADTADQRYHYFAYKDAAIKGECNPNALYLDWYIELEAGHRIYSAGFAAADQIYFGSATSETENPCAAYLNGVADTAGILYAVNHQGEILMERATGDVATPLLVEDEHIYFRTLSGLRSLGRGIYNNDVLKSGAPVIKVHAWLEVE